MATNHGVGGSNLSLPNIFYESLDLSLFLIKTILSSHFLDNQRLRCFRTSFKLFFLQKKFKTEINFRVDTFFGLETLAELKKPTYTVNNFFSFSFY